jgi:hypothetical protein
MKLNLQRMTGVLLSIAGSCALVQSVQAQFVDTNRDLILTFRKTGEDGSGDIASIDFEVNIGQASIYYGATPNSTIPITAYNNLNQLDTLFDSLNDLSWSVGGGVPETGDNGNPSKPPRTLWLTDPRNDPNTPAVAWTSQSTYSQGPVSAHVVSILSQAQAYGSSATANSVTNAPTSVAIPTSSGYEAGGYLGPYGNYLGTFEGDAENTTPSLFAYGSSPSRSDFYELQPGSGSGTYLGYFELETDGSMTFNAKAAVQTYPAPTLSVSTNGSGSILVSFPSTLNGTYSLHYTNMAELAAPVSTWPTVSTNITGDGTVKTFLQPISGAGTVYSVSVH